MKGRLKGVALCMLCTLFAFLGPLAQKGTGATEQRVQGYKQIIELWHIDSFDGGVGSRKDFLLSQAIEFEKKNNVIVSVISHTVDSAQSALSNSVPDMISCGNGLDIADKLTSIPIKNNYNVCLYNGNTYGVAWARGAYALIGSGEKKNLIVSQAEYTQPLKALLSSGISFNGIEVLPSSKAYGEFLRRGGYLLGTQRDIYRLYNRQFEFEYQPLEYSDLFQVIAVTSQNTQKKDYCLDFIAYLLSDKVQKNLTKIGMFSTMGHTLYKGEITEKLEQAKIKEFTSFLTSPEKLKQMQMDSLNKLRA